MKAFLYVGLGGAIGAMARYGFSMISMKAAIPINTLLINLLGSILIGFIAQLALSSHISPQLVLLIKTGICGGFTTFSTFSLETFQLIEKKAWIPAVSYIFASVMLCVIGVSLGMYGASLLTRKFSF
ncbi:fluoride efflux transporter CrcB [Absiella sp. AM29-15]|uniref:fluoride efflux transporter CrcB n=1 Tax=Absiella sp. AM29-15 TaxID=2292278 RepID=UPI000E4248D7|nr:fluoride efflux transporter CrcB [Absiella sp. AM29-15]RGC52805.1 fluoride efflux transporter CrcB [Absiella sp. AM29-15]